MKKWKLCHRCVSVGRAVPCHNCTWGTNQNYHPPSPFPRIGLFFPDHSSPSNGYVQYFYKLETVASYRKNPQFYAPLLLAWGNCVGYCDQQKGALQAVCWLKSFLDGKTSFSIFFHLFPSSSVLNVKKCKNNKKHIIKRDLPAFRSYS